MPRVKWGASTRIGHFPYGHFVHSFHRDTTHFTFFIKNTSSSVSVSYSDSDGTSLREGAPAISSFWILSIFSILLQVFILNFSVVRCSFDFWTAVRFSWLDIPNVQNGTNDDFFPFTSWEWVTVAYFPGVTHSFQKMSNFTGTSAFSIYFQNFTQRKKRNHKYLSSLFLYNFKN